jgi:hypothetical protein
MNTPLENRDLGRPASPGEAQSPIAKVDGRAELPCQAADDEPMGGDPPCWAHLFEDDVTAEDR